jgi:hypothetical protein
MGGVLMSKKKLESIAPPHSHIYGTCVSAAAPIATMGRAVAVEERDHVVHESVVTVTRRG